MELLKLMKHDDRYIIRSFSHEEIDKVCRDSLGLRPYKLGETKQSKINKIRAYLNGGM